MLAAAAALGAMPITTAKDRLRLPAGVRERVQVFEVKLVFEDPAAVEAMLARLQPRAA